MDAWLGILGIVLIAVLIVTLALLAIFYGAVVVLRALFIFGEIAIGEEWQYRRREKKNMKQGRVA